MLYAPIILLAFASPADDCNLRATIAGKLMILHQTGAGAPAVTAAARTTRMPDFATSLVTRVLSAETSPDGPARELAAYHFAAEIHAECLTKGYRMS